MASAFVDVTPDTSGFKERLKAALDEAVAGLDAKVKVSLDTSDLDAKADAAKAKVRDLGETKADAKLGADDTDLKAKTSDAKAKVDEVGAKRATARLGADSSDLTAKADDAKGRLDEVDRRKAEPKLGLDDSEFNRKLDEDKAKLATSGSGGGIWSALTAGPLGGTLGIGGIAAGAGALIPGLGGALAGLGGTLGAGALAFTGVQQAMSDFQALQQQKQSGAFGAQQAALSFSNTVQIQQAQQAIAQAHAQAAQVAVTSAEQIKASQMSLAVTERNAAQSDIQAQQSVVQAQQQMQSANFSLAQAQYSLSNAWIQARYNLQQLNDQERNSATSIAAAKLAVQQAIYNQQQTDQNALSTQLQRAQAAIAVQQAQQQLTAAQQQATYVAAEAHLQDKKGVAGSQQVLSAQQAVKQAIYGVTQAQQAYANAQRNLTITQLNNAAQVKAAQMAVAMAEQQAAYQQQQAAVAVQTAQRNLTNTYKAQQLQMAASGNAANKFAQDMNLLTGPQRTLVREFMSFNGVLQQMQATAGKAMLPGVTVFFRGLHSFLPSVMSAISKFGGVAGQIMKEIGQALGSKSFQQGFASIVNQGVTFMKLFGGPVAGMFRSLFNLWAKGGPASAGFARLLGGLATAFGNLFKALEPAIKPIGTILSVLGKALAVFGGALGHVITGLLTALAPALKALLPGFSKFVSVLGSSLGKALASLAPVMAAVGTELGNFLIGLTPLLPPLAQLIGAVAQGLMPAFRILVPIAAKLDTILGNSLASVIVSLVPVISQMGVMLAQNATAMAQVFLAVLPLIPTLAKLAIQIAPFVVDLLKLATTISGPIITVFTDMITWLIKAGEKTGWLGGIFKTVWKAIETATLWLWHNVIDPAFHGIAAGATWLYNNAIHPLWTGISTVFGWIKTAANFLWHNVFDPLWSGIKWGAQQFVNGFRTVWNGLKDVFRTPVNFLIGTVYDKGIARLWNDVVTHIGLSSIKLPIIPTMATGGIIPGYAPGQDTVPAMLSPGEGVLTPQAVQAIGPDTIHALNAAYGPGGKSDGHHFAPGGIVSGIGNVLGSIGRGISTAWHDVTGAISLASAILTGNTTAFANAAGKFIGTHAAGDLGKMMIGIPKTLVTDLAKHLISSVSSLFGGGKGGPLPGGSSGAVGNLPANWKTIAAFLASHGFTKYAAAGVAGNILAESGGNPEILQIGGGGGGGLIQWTPFPPGYITGNAAADLSTQLHAILSWGGGPGLVNRATSPSNAALIYQDYYERPANLTASLPTRMAGANAVYQAMGWGKFDNGGVLMPGAVGYNTTGRPEAVLNPEESQAVVALARELVTMKRGGAAPSSVTQIFHGAGNLTAENRAEMRRDLALALSGG